MSIEREGSLVSLVRVFFLRNFRACLNLSIS